MKNIEWSDRKHGFRKVFLSSWNYYGTVINEMLLDRPHVIFRGQQLDEWPLVSSLTRLVQRSSNPNFDSHVHLKNFLYASRGRHNFDFDLDNKSKINEYWATGQHFGLATPFIDFTQSPFVALFFAFETYNESNSHRVVFALNMNRLENECKKLNITNEDNEVLCFNSFTNNNQRVVNQAGLFLKIPVKLDMENWLKNNIDENYERTILAKIYIPNKNRDDCLKSLNRMNINHLTLFPDLYGASNFANFKSEIINY